LHQAQVHPEVKAISQMQFIERPSWETHDFKVKMLDWSAARGSRLRFSCRLCARDFCHFTTVNHGRWAVDNQGRPLENAVSVRWLADSCPRIFVANDDEDRKRLRDVVAQ